MGSQRVRHDWATSLSLFTFMHWRRKWQPTPVFLPGESQGRGSLVGCLLWYRRVRHSWSDLAVAASRCYLSPHKNPVRYVVAQNFRSSGRLNQIIWGFLATKWYSHATVLWLRSNTRGSVWCFWIFMYEVFFKTLVYLSRSIVPLRNTYFFLLVLSF